VDALEGGALAVDTVLASWSASSVSIRSRFVVPGRGEEGSNSSKSANERFGGIGRGDLDSVEETGISRQPRRVTIHLF